MAEFAVILVHSTSHAIQIEALLRGSGIPAKLVPTPRQLSSDCGSAVRIAGVDRDRCERLLANHRIAFERIVALD